MIINYVSKKKNERKKIDLGDIYKYFTYMPIYKNNTEQQNMNDSSR